MLQECQLNPLCPKSWAAQARNKDPGFSLLFFLTPDEITTLNRRPRTSTDSKSSTTLKSRNRTRCIFSKLKWGCGSILAKRKLPQNILPHLYPCLYLTGPTAPVFSSPWKTSIPSSSFPRAKSLEYTCIIKIFCFQRRNLQRQIFLFTEDLLPCPNLVCNAPSLTHTGDTVTTTPNKSLLFGFFSAPGKSGGSSCILTLWSHNSVRCFNTKRDTDNRCLPSTVTATFPPLQWFFQKGKSCYCTELN